jgi:hypothetical protein
MGGAVEPEEFDYFHEVGNCKLIFSQNGCIELVTQAIIHAELARVSSRAAVDGLLAGLVIALPPVLNYASPELYEKVVPDVSGKMI